ncbi:MurR/RpiR family transcriptional regulator [Brachybacterium sp. Z12]|uniref:MurR/RpiR family transcriptional regulator n=1 Tax=Brachybacterium sp. Z12 TaxID=2759167 RepID=UPI00186135BF|nr:MurR/RpiR family transcriptional regulator [Brachybacterium sp. Z12]QNN82121.1 MurR/RpiR family transcriptional regulator [Brachybacterium sp. Z12]
MRLPVLPRLRGRRDDLQPVLRRIADVVLADPVAAAGLTIDQLAAAATCAQSSVVNFARELGFSGYRDFRRALVEETARAVAQDAELLFPIAIDAADPLAVSVSRIAAADARAVRDTVRLLDLAVLEEVAAILTGSRRIVLVGAGASGLAAMDLQYKLTRLGFSAHALTSAHDALPAVAGLGAQDCLVGISDSGRTTDVLDALALATEGGARTLAITGAPASPLARGADHTLLTASREPSFRAGATSSRIAQLAIADCLLIAVAAQLPDAGQEALHRTRAALEARRT